MGQSKDGVLRACGEMPGTKMGMTSKADTRWWKLDTKEEISRAKDAHNVICRISSQENKNRYKYEL